MPYLMMDTMEDRRKYIHLLREYREKVKVFNRLIGKLQELYLLAHKREKYQLMQDIKEEIEDYRRDHEKETVDIFKKSQIYYPPYPAKQRILWIEEAIKNMDYTINELPDFIEHMRNKIESTGRKRKTKKKPNAKRKKR